MIFLFFLLFVAFSYFFLLLHLANGWRNLPGEVCLSHNPELYISIIVPFRNEEKNLSSLVRSILDQSYPNFELILVDDHSTDNTLATLAPYLNQTTEIKIIKASAYGKKNAIKEGIAQAHGQLIVCTDADCLPKENWLKAIAQFQERENCDLIIAPVSMRKGKSFFSKLQSLEFMSLIASGGAAAAVLRPVLCNGANLAFTKACWNASKADLKEEEASGDDMFLLMSVKKRKGKIRFLKAQDAIVETAVSETWLEFFNQRKRWVSKSKSYTDPEVIVLAMLVFVLSAGFLVCLVGGFFNPIYWKTALFIYLLKSLADISLLMPAAKFFSLEKRLKYIPLLQIVYPFYVVGTAFAGLFGKFSWK